MHKLSFVLIGLVGMLSSLVIASAYFTSTQQAFVSAEVKLDIDFGTVFPGTVVQDYFQIESDVPCDYTLTLGAPADPGVIDLRPYLLIERDTTEADTVADGPISGDPDYTGNGTFESESDLSDKWLVTFFVPDDIGDYDCVVSIVPVVVP